MLIITPEGTIDYDVLVDIVRLIDCELEKIIQESMKLNMIVVRSDRNPV